jgi:uncharacterized protein YjiS (DUF1127 family)
MEMIMSTTVDAPAAQGDRARSRGSTLITAVRALWTSYLIRCIERATIIQLQAMSDRELLDIGLTRSEIAWVVRGERDHWPVAAAQHPSAAVVGAKPAIGAEG